VQIGAEIGIGAGLSVRIGAGLAMRHSDDAVYGYVPVSAGLRWRPARTIRPVVGAHLLLLFNRDGRGASGEVVEGASRAPAVGGCGEVGLEFPLYARQGFELAMAPALQVGWAGLFTVQAGLALRTTWK